MRRKEREQKREEVGLGEQKKRCLPTNRKVSFGPNNFAFFKAFHFAFPAFTFLVLLLESLIVISDISQDSNCQEKSFLSLPDLTPVVSVGVVGDRRKSQVEEMSV